MGRAIAFTANPESPNYVGGLKADEIARTSPEGLWALGKLREYLHQTVLSLDAAGIHDGYLWDLQERVAELIEAQTGRAERILAKLSIMCNLQFAYVLEPMP